jgi:uncharacterized membrane protein YphA (DoxX/SURF4 family)
MNASPGVIRRLDQTGLPLLAGRLVLGGMFIYLGYNKAIDPVGFLKLVREYPMVPESTPVLLNLIAVILPWLEILCGILLIAGVAVRGNAVLMLLMLAVFTGAVALRTVGIYNAEEIAFCAIKFDCGCGVGEVFICKKLLENSGLLLLSLLVLLSQSRKYCLKGNLLS